LVTPNSQAHFAGLSPNKRRGSQLSIDSLPEPCILFSEPRASRHDDGPACLSRQRRRFSCWLSHFSQEQRSSPMFLRHLFALFALVSLVLSSGCCCWRQNCCPSSCCNSCCRPAYEEPPVPYTPPPPVK